MFHPITFIRGVVFVQSFHSITSSRGVFGGWKNTHRIDVIGCKFVHHVTSISGVVFVQIYILLRLFVDWFWSGKNAPRIDVIHGKLNPIW